MFQSIALPYIGFYLASVGYRVMVQFLITKSNLRDCVPTLGNLVLNALLGGGRLESVNLPLWYLHCYFLAAMIFYLIVKYNSIPTQFLLVCGLVLITCPFQSVVTGRPPFHINVLPAALVYLIVGYWFHWFLEYKEEMLKKVSRASLFLLAFVLLLAGYRTRVGGAISAIGSEVHFISSFLSIYGYVAFSMALGRCRILECLGKRSLFILGVHPILGEWVYRFINMAVPELNEKLLCIPACTIIVIGSYLLGEIWYLLWAKILIFLKRVVSSGRIGNNAH